MIKDQQEIKKFLKEQIEWDKRQDVILEDIETKLSEMKALAEYARNHNLSLMETNLINEKLNILK